MDKERIDVSRGEGLIESHYEGVVVGAEEGSILRGEEKEGFWVTINIGEVEVRQFVLGGYKSEYLKKIIGWYGKWDYSLSRENGSVVWESFRLRVRTEDGLVMFGGALAYTGKTAGNME